MLFIIKKIKINYRMSSPSFPFAPLSIEVLSLDYLLESFLQQFSNHFEWVSLFSFSFFSHGTKNKQFFSWICKRMQGERWLSFTRHTTSPRLSFTWYNIWPKSGETKQGKTMKWLEPKNTKWMDWNLKR